MRTLILLFALPCAAATVVYDFQGSVTNTDQCCANVITFEVPQFTGQGLTSVDWVLMADANYQGGVNLPWYEPGLPYSYNFTVGVQSTLLGMDVESVSQTYTGVTGLYGSQISAGTGGGGDPTLTASGSAPDVAPFEGNGMLLLTLIPIGHGSYGAVAFSGINQITTRVNLELTYDPPDAVPEPRWGVLALLPIVAGWRWFGAHFRSYRGR